MAHEKSAVVQTLNLMMTKKGILPEYELVYDGHENGDGTFIYQVGCGEHVIKAPGNSKKEAKRNAAMMMLNLMKQNDARILERSGDGSKTEEWWARMPVNTLQAICVREELPYPHYEEIETRGPHHSPLFTTQCTVSPFIRRGQGTSKKSSKQDAAKNMIFLLSEKRESTMKIIEELSKSLQIPEIPSDKRNGIIVKTDDAVDSSLIVSSNDSISSEKYEDPGPILPSEQTSQSNINDNVNGINPEVIEESKVPSQQSNSLLLNINELVDNMTNAVIKSSPEPSKKKFQWPRGYLLCQRRSLVRKLQNLSTALENPNVRRTQEFDEEFENILRLLDVAPDQIIQRTHDDKIMMAIYVSTDPMIVDVAVDVDEVNLKILLYQRVVETLLNIILA